MKSIVGWLFQSLSYRVEKEIKESLYTNTEFLMSRWHLIEFNVIRWSTHYSKYISLLFLSATLWVVNLYLWKDLLKTEIQSIFPHWESLLGLQGLFLAGQLTIIGVVYPLVVGLVGVLFQNKSGKNVLFPAYQKYSGFMFAGLSGLTLSIWMIFGFIFKTSIENNAYLAICVINSFWLIFNLLLTFWFFVQTFNILNEKFRNRLLIRFAIHEVFEMQIRKRISDVLVYEPIANGMLKEINDEYLKINENKTFSEDKENLIKVVPRNKSQVEIKYSILYLGLKIQRFLLKMGDLKGCEVSIRPSRNTAHGSEMILINYSGFKMTKFMKIIFKLSFSFYENKDIEDVGFSMLLTSLISPVDDALRDGNSRIYENAISDLVDWHTEISLALSFTNNEKKLDNWLLLRDQRIFGFSFLDSLLREYYRLAREAVEKIPDNSSYYADVLRLHRRIYSNRNKITDVERLKLITGSYNLWHILIEWRSFSDQIGSNKIDKLYQDTLFDFVGAWENWLPLIEPKTKRSEETTKSIPMFLKHLEFTAATTISALRFNNYEAAGWGVDMLNNWLDKLIDRDSFNAEYRWHSVLVNHKLLMKETTDVSWDVILKGNKYIQEEAFNLAFKNAHLDLRILSACYLLLKPNTEKNDFIVKYIDYLLSGKSIHPTGTIKSSIHIVNTPSDILGAYIRHKDYANNGLDTYHGWLESILESFGSIYSERRVSGRVYMGWGRYDLDSMNEAYVEIAVSMSNSKWSLDKNWLDALHSNYFSFEDRKNLARNLKEWIDLANKDTKYTLISEEDSANYKENFKTSIEDIIQSLKNKNHDQITKANLDENRLKEFGVAASASIVQLESIFPLNLFPLEKIHLNEDIEDDDHFYVNIKQYDKENISKGIDRVRAINEDEWLASIIESDIKNRILSRLLKSTLKEANVYSEVNSLIESLLEKLNYIKAPILFTGDQDLITYLFRSEYETDGAERYGISRKDGFSGSYICHIGACPIYRLNFSDVEYSLLTSKDIFDNVGFKRLDENQYVEASFSLDRNSTVTGELKLKYWMKINLAEGKDVIKLERDK